MSRRARSAAVPTGAPQTTDRRAHLTDPALYHEILERDQHPGVIHPMERVEPRLMFACERIGRDDTVLDIGCFKSAMTVHLWTRTRRRVVGVDISHNALRHAHALASKAPFDITYAQAWAEALPFRDGTFDVAVLCEILEHVADVDAVVREAERVVRPGGRVILSVPRDALAVDALDARRRSAAFGMEYDAHVRDLDVPAYFANRRDLDYALGQVVYPDGDKTYFHMASYIVA